MEWRWVGLEPLAIVFSLTYALLMWSYVTFQNLRPLYGAHFFNRAWGFFVALLIFSFQNTSKKIWIPVGSAAGIVAILIVWCVWNTWDSEEGDEEDIDWPYEPEPQSGNGTQA